MIVLPNSLKSESEKPHGEAAWIWCWELEAKAWDGVTNPTLFRFTSWHEDLVWPVSDPTAKTWYPFPFAASPIEQSSDGSLPQIDLAIDNSTRMAMRYLHESAGMIGNRATAFLIQASGKDIAYPNHEFLRFDFTITGASANDQVVTLRLELPNLLDRKTPEDRFVAGKCRWEHGGPECGYRINTVAAFQTCGKRYSDCQAHGVDEAARNIPVLHPMRFGGFLGIPVQRSR